MQMKEETLLILVPEAAGLITALELVTARVLAAAPRLRVICCAPPTSSRCTSPSHRPRRVARALSQERSRVAARERTDQQALHLERERLGGRRLPVGDSRGRPALLRWGVARRHRRAVWHAPADRVLRGLRADRQRPGPRRALRGSRSNLVE